MPFSYLNKYNYIYIRRCVKSRKTPFTSAMTRATQLDPFAVQSAVYTLKNVRHFTKSEVNIIKTSCLGSGAFGKCFLGTLGPLDVCIKVFRSGKEHEAYFPGKSMYYYSVAMSTCQLYMAYMMVLKK